MITLLILILFIITLCLFTFRFIKTGITALIITFVLFFMDGVGIIPALLLKNLEVYPLLTQLHWSKHNAIVCLGAGAVNLRQSDTIKPTIMAYSRIFEAAQLYYSCKKTHNECTIIISGGDALAKGKSEAEIYQNELNTIGIDNSDIILEPNSMNTYQNAEFTSAILKSKQFDSVFLDTSGIHMRRSLLYFSHFGINAIPSTADYIEPKMFTVTLGYNIAISDFAAHEYAGIIRYYIYNYFGLNTYATAPGSL